MRVELLPPLRVEDLDFCAERLALATEHVSLLGKLLFSAIKADQPTTREQRQAWVNARQELRDWVDAARDVIERLGDVDRLRASRLRVEVREAEGHLDGAWDALRMVTARARQRRRKDCARLAGRLFRRGLDPSAVLDRAFAADEMAYPPLTPTIVTEIVAWVAEREADRLEGRAAA